MRPRQLVSKEIQTRKIISTETQTCSGGNTGVELMTLIKLIPALHWKLTLDFLCLWIYHYMTLALSSALRSNTPPLRNSLWNMTQKNQQEAKRDLFLFWLLTSLHSAAESFLDLRRRLCRNSQTWTCNRPRQERVGPRVTKCERVKDKTCSGVGGGGVGYNRKWV